MTNLHSAGEMHLYTASPQHCSPARTRSTSSTRSGTSTTRTRTAPRATVSGSAATARVIRRVALVRSALSYSYPLFTDERCARLRRLLLHAPVGPDLAIEPVIPARMKPNIPRTLLHLHPAGRPSHPRPLKTKVKASLDVVSPCYIDIKYPLCLFYLFARAPRLLS